MRQKHNILKWIVVILICLGIIGTGFLLRRESWSRSGDFAYALSQPITPDREVRQYFTATESYMYALCFAVDYNENATREGNLIFSMYNQKGKLILQETIPYQNMRKSTYYRVVANKWLKKGAEYYYTVTVDFEGENNPCLVYSADPAMYVPENISLDDDYSQVEGQGLNWYIWGMPLDYKNLICIWAWIAIVGLVLLELIDKKQVS